MPGYNHVAQIGHLGKDPELRYTPQGTPICSFTMAVNVRKKIDGEWKDSPIWFKVTIWGKQAESVSQYLTKGRSCLAEGSLDVETWTDRDGKERTTLVINATNVVFLDSGGDRGERPQNSGATGERPRAATPPPPPPAATTPISDDDIPF
jgi:single-strand DNA-binding protein